MAQFGSVVDRLEAALSSTTEYTMSMKMKIRQKVAKRSVNTFIFKFPPTTLLLLFYLNLVSHFESSGGSHYRALSCYKGEAMKILNN